MVANQQNSRRESPWIPRPKSPHGVQQAVTVRKRVRRRLQCEPPLEFIRLDELRQSVIRMIARRAAAILKEKDDDTEGQ